MNDRTEMTIIDLMINIQEIMKDEDNEDLMPLDNMHKAEEEISSLACRLKMEDPLEVVFLTAIIRKYSDYMLSIGSIIEDLGIDPLRSLKYHYVFKSLWRRSYILLAPNGHITISAGVINSLMENRPVNDTPTMGLTAIDLLHRIEDVLSLREQDLCSTRDALEELSALMALNPDNSVSRCVREYLGQTVVDAEGLVLYGLIHQYYTRQNDLVRWEYLEDYFTREELSALKGLYFANQLGLQNHKKQVIEFTGTDGFIDSEFFHLTQNAKEQIFADTGGVRKKAPTVSASRRLEASTIPSKVLFYNISEERDVARLMKILSPEHFDGIRVKMKEKGFPSGFTCLFYGAPGTGKTETAYQVARESGRDLFIVDVSEIKDPYVGNSEKNIKDVFKKYRECVKGGGAVPILLFNEADAIFGIRSLGAERAVDKMENAVQNILLQEMEDLDGILIATTNLTANLDSAFERRFLYKVRFDKPSPEVRAAIWRSLMPSLTKDEASTLATEFNFSGGQIENVVRKREVESIISLQEPTFADMLAFCQKETILADDSRKIGF